MDTRALLHEVADRAADWLDSMPDRPVYAERGPRELDITDDLPDHSQPIEDVIARIAAEAAPGLTPMNSPRYFGFVIGGTHPAALAADWLAAAWDQNAGLSGPLPAAAAVEDTAGEWLRDVLGLPAAASYALEIGRASCRERG